MVTEITSVGTKGLRAGSLEFFGGDSVVIAVGAKANKELAETLKDKPLALYFAGDCIEPRRIVSAIHEGFQAASEV